MGDIEAAEGRLALPQSPLDEVRFMSQSKGATDRNMSVLLSSF